jgi:hypothetical protein
MPRTFLRYGILRCVARRGANRAEVEDQPLPALVGESEGAAAGRCEAEIRHRLAEHFQRF